MKQSLEWISQTVASPTLSPEQRLANAIVKGACDDWREAMRGRPYTEYKTCGEIVAETEAFLKSDYYNFLTKLRPDFLLEKLVEEYNDGLKLIAAGNQLGDLVVGEKYTFTCPICGGDAEVTEKHHKSHYWKQYTCTHCKTTEWREVYVKGGG